ncbi:hypothetical protein Mal4_05350 [Maioricimonas rarisocia]|uniref:ATPase AAA-type core domain-containing protein n=1 Tax=Maioricimonas rarisocia TaxID=2528026 RepID=A0A517Z1A8_9PLAN|nr:ATP-binding protein [Maioricimonas rarisocia]QDU36251.1 hypothetical protein Mal4_05350 [Maioricimonas rarisocia]
MAKLLSARLERFKRISDAPIDLKEINVIVGANNSGKSSLIQGLHFAVGVLQTVHLAGWRLRDGTTSVNPNELIYTPSERVYSLGLGGKLTEKPENAITVTFVLDTGDSCTIAIRKGRNRNIAVTLENASAAQQLGSLEEPFTIFSPGLAGISKNESYVSDGVLLRTLARGDANLVLRNILCRLWSTQEWDSFIDDLHNVFPALEIRVGYSEATDEFISVELKAESEWVPIELAGTGILQAIQILSYIHRFKPSLVVLDEPDSHLHPNNQRLLCALLRSIAQDRDVQILLTTHSRHVVDALSGSSHILWARNATIDVATTDDEIGILLDIGALDVKERVSAPNTSAVVLTEDENTRRLEVMLVSSGFDLARTVLIPYYGATQIKNLRPLVKMIQSTAPQARIILHRDRDYLNDDAIDSWQTKVRALNVDPFVTYGTDIESHFVSAEYLARANARELDSFTSIIEDVAKTRREALVEAYVNGLINVARHDGTHGRLNAGKLAATAAETIESNPERFRHGKTMLRGIREIYRQRFAESLRDAIPDESIAVPELQTVATKVFGSCEHRG